MSRTMTLAGATLAALLAGGLTVGVASAAPDRDCPSFATQQEAQRYFESIGGSADNNADLLDDNGDGVACEDRPSGGGGTAEPEPSTPAPADEDNDGQANESTDEPAATDDDDSTADTNGSQVEVVPEGSADTGGV